MKILVIGASGMIGSTLLRVLSENKTLNIFGTIRNEGIKNFFSPEISSKLLSYVDVENFDALIKVFEDIRPDVVINCAGLTKHKVGASDPLTAVPVNSVMPHRLASLSKLVGARLIHISTDCVFSGEKGGYTEGDQPDARDVYGKSKALGELFDLNTVTLRTSTIGHEMLTQHGLLEWFLSIKSDCLGFRRAIFSGLPTVIFAQVIRDIVIPSTELTGLYHVAAKPINKYDLLKLISKVYKKSINIVPDESFIIDRSLNAAHFRGATGYIAPDWEEMIYLMHQYK